MSDPQAPRRIGVAAHPQLPEASALAEQIVEHLRTRGVHAFSGLLFDQPLRDAVIQGGADLLVVLGGDGTMLRAGHLCAPAGVPILGINLGRFGFLIEVEREHWKAALEQVLGGEYWLERRMMLRVELLRQERTLGSWDVLNECLVGRGEVARPVRLVAEVDGRQVTTYVADGLIVATPTGSTAYALAAGGPILPPELRNILLIAVAPHLSVDRAIVLHEGSRVRITVRTDHQASLSADGQAPVRLEDGDRVEARAGEHAALFVRLRDAGYFYANLLSRMGRNPTAGDAQ
jgi:NAD+ kinase